ncbi:MAG: glucokinase [Acidobacteriota bacterium]|jgi:glucokinase|nr:glucokinase [Acidobacteriota bacterium]
MTESGQLKNKSLSENELVIAVDLGGTNLRTATIDSEGRIYERTKQSTPKATKPEEIVSTIAAAARECERHSHKRGAKVGAVSVVVPGTVRADEGVVMRVPNIPCLDDFHLADALQNELRWPSVIENDANAAAVGEMWKGAGRGRKSIIMITLGTGVGGGVILDGKLWRGIDGSAGELGHIGVEPFGGVHCPCGSIGCLEVYASATAIVRQAREMLSRYPDSPLKTTEDLTAASVYQSGEKGDELALEVFRQMGTYLGIGLASLINVFNPEVIVIGGGAADGWDLFIPHVREQVTKRAFKIPAERAEIVRAERGDDAGLLGAAHIAFAG